MNEKAKESRLSNNLYIKVSSLIVIFKFKKVVWSSQCSTLSPSPFGYTSQIDLSNFPPPYYSSMKRFVNGNVLPWFLSEEISDGMYSSS